MKVSREAAARAEKENEDNLAALARVHPEPEFIRWVLNPSSVRSNTTMPALSDRLPEAERRRIAKALLDYLTAVSVLR